MKKRKLLLVCGLCSIAGITSAQYYHKDIVSVKQANAEIARLKSLKIKSIAVHSFEADGTASEGFHCEKKLSRDFRNVETITESPGTSRSIANADYNQQGWIISSSDSSEITAATSLYEYDNQGNISRITSYTHSSDDDFSTSLKEVHAYSYNSAGQPVKMLKIKNDTDTVQIDFIIDEKGNVTDEIEPGKNGKHYYYYYDSKNRITDIVRYNVVKQAMRPDFIFEYNQAGQLVQMITVEEGIPGNYYSEKDAANYLTWKYFYDDDGLRIIEKCFSNKNSLLGYVEYEYN